MLRVDKQSHGLGKNTRAFRGLDHFSRVGSGEDDPARPAIFENLLTPPDPTRPDLTQPNPTREIPTRFKLWHLKNSSTHPTRPVRYFTIS